MSHDFPFFHQKKAGNGKAGKTGKKIGKTENGDKPATNAN
jgi:hypothetical protein